jgi:hypothetical protein
LSAGHLGAALKEFIDVHYMSGNDTFLELLNVHARSSAAQHNSALGKDYAMADASLCQGEPFALRERE